MRSQHFVYPRPTAYGRSKNSSNSVQQDGVSICDRGPVMVGSQSFTAKEERSGSTLERTLFILKRSDGLHDFAVFESVLVRYREGKKYVFEITTPPIDLRGQAMMVNLMSRKDLKLAAVELVKSFGR